MKYMPQYESTSFVNGIKVVCVNPECKTAEFVKNTKELLNYYETHGAKESHSKFDVAVRDRSVEVNVTALKNSERADKRTSFINSIKVACRECKSAIFPTDGLEEKKYYVNHSHSTIDVSLPVF